MHGARLLILYLAFVVYGSLVPLDYQPLAFDEALRRFAATPFLRLDVGARGDWVANGVLYLPLGFLAARTFASIPGVAASLASVLALTLCTAVALAVEFAQLYFPPRTVSQNDLIAEFIGSALGIALAFALRGWTDRLAQALRAGGARLVVHGLEAYALAYLVLGFFPFDLLVSWRELQGKADTRLWGWVLAHSDRGLGLVLVQLVAECALAMPLGVWLALRSGSPTGSVPVGRAAVIGLALGAAIEIGQFFVASGVSQGASILARALGIVAGTRLVPYLRTFGIEGLRGTLRRATVLAAAAYLPMLLAVNGWFRAPWHGLDGAASTWSTLRLLPFYYHYYTSEAVALYSLGTVALMYAPIAAAGWAWRWSAAGTVLVTVTLAAIVEAGKLFVPGLHPDPTNLLIAGAANAAFVSLASAAQRPLQELPTPSRVEAAPRRRPAVGLAALAVPVALWWAWQQPAFSTSMLVVLLTCAVVVWRVPVAALAIVPASLPMLDFAPWTGRFFIDEFDAVLLVCLGLAWGRLPPAGASRRTPTVLVGTAALLAISLAASTAAALVPLTPIDDNAFANYGSVFNALRIVKGGLWAWAFAVIYRRAAADPARADQALMAGMLVGLSFVAAWVVWERAAFVGLLDFGSAFRVSGPFSAMHRGGAYVECYLAVAAAFAVTWTVRSRHLAARAAGAALLLATTYAVMVTFSRNGYAAYAVAVLGALAVGMGRGTGARRRWAAALVVLPGVAAVAWPVLVGGFAGERLARSRADLGVRAAHWADALEMRSEGGLRLAVGEGIGRYPDLHHWRSREAARAARYRIEQESHRAFLRLAPGATLYVEQIIAGPAGGDLYAELELRSSGAATSLGIALCRKWLLTSRDCVSARVPVAARDAGAAWQQVRVPLAPRPAAAQRGGWLDPPLVLSLMTPGGPAAVDVGRIGLRDSGGNELVANGDFKRGMDRWFFTTDVDPPWQIHSLPVAVVFDQGWFGALAWTLYLGTALILGAASIRSAGGVAAAAWVGTLAFLVSASLNTLIDNPRFLWLLLVLSWLAGATAAWQRSPAGPSGAAAGRRA